MCAGSPAQPRLLQARSEQPELVAAATVPHRAAPVAAPLANVPDRHRIEHETRIRARLDSLLVEAAIHRIEIPLDQRTEQPVVAFEPERKRTRLFRSVLTKVPRSAYRFATRPSLLE